MKQTKQNCAVPTGRRLVSLGTDEEGADGAADLRHQPAGLRESRIQTEPAEEDHQGQPLGVGVVPVGLCTRYYI